MANPPGRGQHVRPEEHAHDKMVEDVKKKHVEADVPDALAKPQPGKEPALVQNRG